MSMTERRQRGTEIGSTQETINQFRAEEDSLGYEKAAKISLTASR